MKRISSIAACVVIALVLVVMPSQAQLSYTTPNVVLEENFDSLPHTGTSNVWQDNVTLPGWFLVNSTGAVPTYIRISDGSDNTGAFYSFGKSGSTERALGGVGSGGAYFGTPASGALAGYWGVKIKNDTGLTLTNFTVIYDVEQWRDGGNVNVQPLISEWAIEPGGWLTTGWNFGASTDSPVHTSSARALNGNDSANRVADVSFSSGSILWEPGQVLWIRFRELNDSGNDHGLAIDNFRLLAIPEPIVVTFGLLVLGGLKFWRKRK